MIFFIRSIVLVAFPYVLNQVTPVDGRHHDFGDKVADGCGWLLWF